MFATLRSLRIIFLALKFEVILDPCWLRAKETNREISTGNEETVFNEVTYLQISYNYLLEKFHVNYNIQNFLSFKSRDIYYQNRFYVLPTF